MTTDTAGAAGRPRAGTLSKPPQHKTDASILEYFLGQVQTALLNEWRAARDDLCDDETMERITSFSDRCLLLANSFLAHYSSSYPNTPLPPTLHLRLLLARFLALFLRGLELSTPFTSSAQKAAFARLRDRDLTRATRWLSRREESAVDISDTSLYKTCVSELESAGIKRRRGQWRAEKRRGTVNGPGMLLDALPVFVTLAGRFSECAGSRSVTKSWVKTLEFFMRLAFIEAVLFRGEDGTGTTETLETMLSKVFSYGAVLGADMTPTELLHAELLTPVDDSVRLEMEEGRRRQLLELHEGLPLDQEEWGTWCYLFEERIMAAYIPNVCASVGFGELSEAELGTAEGWRL